MKNVKGYNDEKVDSYSRWRRRTVGRNDGGGFCDGAVFVSGMVSKEENVGGRTGGLNSVVLERSLRLLVVVE